MGSTIVDSILNDTLWALGALGVALATIAGLWLVLAPAAALSLAVKLNREWSIGWLQRALDAPRTSEPFVYRHHRVVGVLLVIATAYFFWQFITAYDHRALGALFAGALPAVVLEVLALAFTTVLVIGNAVGLALGFVIFFRPSLLKGAEGWANRWVGAPDAAAGVLDRRIDRPEGLAQRYPRRVGIVVLGATLYVVLMALAVS